MPCTEALDRVDFRRRDAPQGGGASVALPLAHLPSCVVAAGTLLHGCGSKMVSANAMRSPPMSGRKKVLIVILAVVAVSAASFAGYRLWMSSTGPELAEYLPADTQVYIELPSVTKAALAAAGMDWLDPTALETDDRNELGEAVERSFGVRRDEAKALFSSIRSVALAGRRSGSGAELERAVVLRVGDRGAVEALLGSTRFANKTPIAEGVRYTLTRANVAGDEERAGLVKSLDELGDSEDAQEGNRHVVAWFSGERLLVTGDGAIVDTIADVVAGKAENLAEHNAGFAKVAWPPGASLLAYADPRVFAGEYEKGLFDGAGPMTGSMRFADPGMLLSAHIELRGKNVPAKALLPERVSLSLYEQLPPTTVAYLAFSTKLGVTGNEALPLFKQAYRAADPGGAERMENMLGDMNALGLGFDSVFDVVGDEAILAVTADEKLPSLALAGDSAAQEHGSIIAILRLDDDDRAKAETLIQTLKTTLEERGKGRVEVQQTEAGLIASPTALTSIVTGVDASMSITIRDSAYLVVVVGSEPHIHAAHEAIGGSAPLKADRAHARALAVVGDGALMVMWLDVGRAGNAMLQASKQLGTGSADSSAMRAITLEGDDRVTAACAVRATFNEDVLSVDIETLNLPAVGALAAARAIAE